MDPTSSRSKSDSDEGGRRLWVKALKVLTPTADEVPTTPTSTTKEISQTEKAAEQQPVEQVAVQPKAVWQEKEPTEPWCPDSIGDHLQWAKAIQSKDRYAQAKQGANGWKVLAATRRGRMHAHEGTHREDAFAIQVGDLFTVVCVADGAGSSKFSRIGSELACRELSTNVSNSCNESKAKLLEISDPGELANALAMMLRNDVHKTQETFHQLSKTTSIPLSDFRCTLLVAVIYENGKTSSAVAGQIGDGFIGFAGKDSFFRLDSNASGEYSGEVKCFLPDEKTSDFFKESLIKCGSMIIDGRLNHSDLRAIFLCTDGIEDPFFPIERNLGKIYDQMKKGVTTPLEGFVYEKGILPLEPAFNSKHGLENLEKWISFQKRGENDDRTLLVIYR